MVAVLGVAGDELADEAGEEELAAQNHGGEGDVEVG